jgi:Holliday junction resolvase RusA-like endonuclease
MTIELEILGFTLYAKPVPQPRHRVGVLTSPKTGKIVMNKATGRPVVARGLPRVKDPVTGKSKAHPVVAYRERLQDAAKEWIGSYGDWQPQFEEGKPVEVYIGFGLPRPKAKVWKRRAMPREHYPKAADIDNLEKAVMDALTGIVWHDDRQIVAKTTAKYLVAGDEQPHVQVRFIEFIESKGD